MTILEFINQLDVWQKLVGAVSGTAGIIFGVNKARTIWKREGVEVSRVDTERTLVDSLHEEFIRINNELESARIRQAEMNRILHEQTLKMNRMEMMILRMYNLLTHNNIVIPEEIKEHMESIFNETSAKND